MNIGIFIGSLSGGGAERVVCDLSNFLVCNNKNNVTVITMTKEEPSYLISKDVKRISLEQIGKKRNFIIKNIKRVEKLKKILEEEKIDVYIAFLPTTSIILLMLKRYIKVPIIIAERNDPSSYNPIKKFLLKKLYPLANAFIFQTEDAKNYYSKLLSDNYIIIPNAINDIFIKTPYSGTRKKEIVSVGRLSKQKNFQLLIKAFSNLSQKYDDYKLIIYGEGPLRKKIEKLVKRLKLHNRVMLPGYVNDISNKIYDSSLFVMSSNFEGIPNALIEAMSMGLPSISTNCPCGGPKYLIENNVNGILVSTNNLFEMQTSIEKILSDKNFANLLSNNAAKIYIDLKSNIIYQKWENFIKLIIEKNKSILDRM